MTEVQSNQWTAKKIMATAAGILALLGAGGTGVYGISSSGYSAQKEIDKAQNARITKLEASIEKVYDKVIDNGKGIERLLERTKK